MLYRTLVTAVIAGLLSACATTSNQKPPTKNPQKVALFSNDQQPQIPYKVIGKASVAKYSLLGGQRDAAKVHAMMKNLAASAGGDAIINVNQNDKSVEGNIIQYQKILI